MCGFTDVGCIVDHAANDLTAGAVNALASAIRAGLTWMLTEMLPMWTKVGSPDLSGDPAITTMQNWLLPVSITVATCAMIAAGARMAITRRAAPLLDIGTGLVTMAAVAALGIALPDVLMKAGDGWSDWILQTATGGQFPERINELMRFGAIPAIMVILLGLIMTILVALQALLLVFRQGAVIMLAMALPLAAAGSIAPATRQWIRKLISWMLALIFYKPTAACVYAAGYGLIGDGKGLHALLMGTAVLILAPLALPALMRFFSWTTGAVSASGGGGQFLATAAGAAVALGALGSRSSTAAQHAADLSDEPSRNALPVGGGPVGGPPPSPSGPSGAGSGNASSTGTGAGPARAADGMATDRGGIRAGRDGTASAPEGDATNKTSAGQVSGTGDPDGTSTIQTVSSVADRAGSASGAASGGAGSAGSASAAASGGAAVAVMLAAQSLASGAKAVHETANSPLQEGDQT